MCAEPTTIGPKAHECRNRCPPRETSASRVWPPPVSKVPSYSLALASIPRTCGKVRVFVGSGSGVWRCDRAPGAGNQDQRYAEIAQRDQRRLANTDTFAVHEAKEGEYRTGQCKAGGLVECTVDHEGAD